MEEWDMRAVLVAYEALKDIIFVAEGGGGYTPEDILDPGNGFEDAKAGMLAILHAASIVPEGESA